MLLTLFENSTAGIAEIEAATGRFVSVNECYCQITGRSEAELLSGLGVTDVLHPDDERVSTSVAEARGETERRYLKPDGRIVWVRISVAVTARDSAGTPTRISAIVQDVTERHAAQERLKESEAMLRLSLEIGQVGCFTRDLITGDIQCTEGTRVMHGFPLDGKPVPTAMWFSMILPEDREALRPIWPDAVTDQLPAIGYEYRFLHPMTGQIRHIEVRMRYEYGRHQKPVAALGAIIDVTAHREAEAQIAHLAFHDTLTGLPNRTFFRKRLETALAQARPGAEVAVLFLDLDGFKAVNDMYGHSVGDTLIRNVATRLQAALPASATIARLGGDEFSIIQHGLEQPAAAAELTKSMLDALCLPFLLDGHRIEIGTSIGVALAPQDGIDVEHLLKAADLALYDAKAGGRGCFRFYEWAMSERVRVRLDLEADLRQALDQGQFVVFYMPILNSETLLPVCMEALVRWVHPTRGLVSPADFIPLAEELGLIVPLGEWVLARACADALDWPSSIRVAVNLSVVQFSRSDVVTIVQSALSQTGLDPSRLELEITETVMLEDTETTLEVLHRLKRANVRIALDDFGTGYSSLSYLQSFPFDKVKIDRSFTRDLGTSARSDFIMRSVLTLCAGLGMTSTVEGVETAEQLRVLAANGCEEVQGFLFSRPMPDLEVKALFAKLAAAKDIGPGGFCYEWLSTEDRV